jgi:hypothetical protein
MSAIDFAFAPPFASSYELDSLDKPSFRLSVILWRVEAVRLVFAVAG